MKATRLLVASFALVFLSQPSFAQKAEVEVVSPAILPSESVVPKLDSPNAVRNRMLRFAKRFEATLTQGWMLDEPYLNNSYTGMEISYHLSEVSGVGLKLGVFGSGISSYSVQLAKDPSKIDYSQVPNPESLLGLTYGHRFMYGKISISQQKVLPTLLEAKTEISNIKQGGRSLFKLGAGVIHRVFFGKYFGFGLGYHFLMHESINPNSVDLAHTSTQFSASEFSKRTEFSHSLELNLNYLF